MKVGFIGLGLMGNPMAKNILKAGFPLTVYNRTVSKTVELQKLGAKVAGNPKELAANSDVVITMVTAGKDVEKVLFGKNGVVEGADKGLTVIDMSTIGPTYARKIAKRLKKYRIDFVDAPVTGSTPKAASAELTIFIGSKPEVYKKVKSLLSSLGKSLHYMGNIGQGQAIKIVNNQTHAAGIVGLIEGILLSDSLGLPRKRVMEALYSSPALSPTMNMILQNYVTEKYPLKFTIANFKKDLTLALEEMKGGNINLPVLRKTQDIYARGVKKMLGSEDFSAIIKVLQK